MKLWLAAILACLSGALAWQAWRLGVTVDEPSHLLSAHLYWHGADRLKPRDMPPLIKIVGGWVAALHPLPVPYDSPSHWDTEEEWLIAQETMSRMDGAEIERVFFLSRLPLIIFPLLVALLLWHWARQLFSPAVALVLALAYALEPTALGHGALFKNDIAATFGYLLFWYRAWQYWCDPRLANAAWLGAGLLVAILSKLSMLFLLPIAPVIVILRYASRRRVGLRHTGVALAAVLLLPYVGALAACQFETRRIPAFEMWQLSQHPNVPKLFLLGAEIFRVLPAPRPMWQGSVALFQTSWDVPVYLLGERYPGGHPLYFLVALAVKAPAALQILLVCGLVLLAMQIRKRRFDWSNLFWIIPPVLYIGLASLSSLQLGVRLILPALPFGLLLCGAAVEWLLRGRRKLVLFCLLAWLAVESLSVYPRGISFFNTWVGGPHNGLRYLADSNLDWGQDLAALAEHVRRHGIEKIRLSYFGIDSVQRYFRDDEVEFTPSPWFGAHAVKDRLQPEPGFYAISASLLPGHYFPERYRDYYKAFREMEPVAKAGYSIYIYRVDR